MRLQDLVWLKELLNIEARSFRGLLRVAAGDQIQDAGCEHRPMAGEKGEEGFREGDLELFLHPAKILVGNGQREFWAWRGEPPNEAAMDFLARHRSYAER